MYPLRSLILTAGLVAAAMVPWAGQHSILASMLDAPLFPGFVMGLMLSGGYSRNRLVAYSTCWMVNTGIYWCVWMAVSGTVGQYLLMRQKNRG